MHEAQIWPLLIQKRLAPHMASDIDYKYLRALRKATETQRVPLVEMSRDMQRLGVVPCKGLKWDMPGWCGGGREVAVTFSHRLVRGGFRGEASRCSFCLGW